MLVKADGEPTYFAADCAYYLDKRERGFDKVVIMLGADHSGYVGRYKALVAALGDDPATHLEILIGQLVNLRARRRAGADEQAGRHGRATWRTWSTRSASTPPATPWPGPRSTSRSTSTSTCGAGRPTTTRSSTSSTRTPGSPRVLRNAADLGLALGEAGDVDVALLAHERESDLLRAIGEFPRVLDRRRRAARAAPGRPVPGGAGRHLPPVLRLLPGAAARRRGGRRR